MAEPAERNDVYVLDASSWITIEGHPARERILWRLTQLIEADRIKSPPEVWDELKKCDWILAWIKDHRSQIVINRNQNVEYLLNHVGPVTHQFSAMAGARGGKDKADPYVVALAVHSKLTSNADWVVVADETLESRPNRKIPTACAAYGVACKTLAEVLEIEFPEDA